MTTWICATCAVEYPAEPISGIVCAICADERQWIPRTGQEWTTVEQLRSEGYRIEFTRLEPHLLGLTVRPALGIGQQAKLVINHGGNLLWDPPGYIDDDAVDEVRRHGHVAAVAASHPHMYGVQTEWARALGARLLVNERDRDWLQRTDGPIEFWNDDIEVSDGLMLHRLGGHFPGSAVAHWRAGADHKGVLLSGDTIFANPDGTASFMRSYPNRIPLSAAVVERVTDTACKLLFDRLYNNFEGVIHDDANRMVRWSAERYIAWVRGDHDNLT